MTKRTNFNKWPENMLVCLKKHLPRPFVETGPCNHLASFGKPEKEKKQLGHQYTWAQKHTCGQSVFGVGSGTMPKFARSLFACSEFVPSSPGVRPEFAPSLFGVRSEFVRSELVRSWFTGNLGPLRNVYYEKTRSAPHFVVCGQNPKKCAHAVFVAYHCFLCENSQLPQTQAQSAKIRAEFGLQHNAFCSYRRGGFIVKFFSENTSSPFLLAAKTHSCLDDPKPLSACSSSCLTLKFFLVLNRIPHANWHSLPSSSCAWPMTPPFEFSKVDGVPG